MSDQAIAPIVRQTLHDELVGRIRDMIIEGQLEPGSRIHEGRLGQALGVSRTPLREALKFLASEGLIDLVPGRGGIVRQLTPQDVRNMLDDLIALETLVGRLACRSATDAQIADVRKLHDRMAEFYNRRRRLEYYKLNQATEVYRQRDLPPAANCGRGVGVRTSGVLAQAALGPADASTGAA